MSTTRNNPSFARDAYAKRFQLLKASLAQIEYFSKGTVLARRVRCGKPQCACAKRPSKRHGPYYEWTYKAKGKTVTVRLRPETAPFYRAAARQYRKLKTILSRLERLSRQALAQLAKDALRRSASGETPGYFHIPRFGHHSQVALQALSH
jgi:hypothetical protein